MKKVFFTAIMLTFALAGTAQNEKRSTTIENGDETVFIYPAKVTVNKGATTTVKITGENDGTEYTYNITGGENAVAVYKYKQTDTSWDFSIPFANKKETTPAERQRGRLVINPTFGWGLIGVTEEDANVELSFGNGSFEYILDRIVGFEYNPTRKSNVGVTFGLDWRNYKMIGNGRWMKEGNNVLVTGYPKGADIGNSRLRTLSLTLSFMYGYKFNKKVNMKIGPTVSFNTRGNIRTCYTLNSEPIKEKQKDVNITPVTVDFRAELKFSFVGLYFKYSPCNVLNTGFGPAFKPMSTGLQFSF